MDNGDFFHSLPARKWPPKVTDTPQLIKLISIQKNPKITNWGKSDVQKWLTSNVQQPQKKVTNRSTLWNAAILNTLRGSHTVCVTSAAICRTRHYSRPRRFSTVTWFLTRLVKGGFNHPLDRGAFQWARWKRFESVHPRLFTVILLARGWGTYLLRMIMLVMFNGKLSTFLSFSSWNKQ